MTGPVARTVIIGNSGSGKSTLAHRIARGRPVLDLDTIAWLPGPVRRPLADSRQDLETFCSSSREWVVEGCYADLVEMAFPWLPELIFLNPGVDTCLAHCRARPWEPHKYASAEAQNANLAFLLEWVRQYAIRDDPCSLARHRLIFESYSGPKRELTEVQL